MAKGPPLKPEEGAQDNLTERLQSLQEEISRLKEIVGPVNDRIADIERTLDSISTTKPVSPLSAKP
jgi:prefoldin subunit 5